MIPAMRDRTRIKVHDQSIDKDVEVIDYSSKLANYMNSATGIDAKYVHPEQAPER